MAAGVLERIITNVSRPRMVKEDPNNYLNLLSKCPFWDLNKEKLDYWQNRQIIIERIAVYGTENDEKIMNLIYPLRTIKKCLIKSDSLDEKVIQYYAFVLHEKEAKFKCYTRIPVQMSF